MGGGRVDTNITNDNINWFIYESEALAEYVKIGAEVASDHFLPGYFPELWGQFASFEHRPILYDERMVPDYEDRLFLLFRLGFRLRP